MTIYTPKYNQNKERSYFIDIACFLVPLLFYQWTNVMPIYFTGILRIVSTHLFLFLHYIFIDKDNYEDKISQKQLDREKKDYLVGIILHMWAQLFLQLLFPGMFFSSFDTITKCIQATLLTHIFVVEPLYYAVHRWLHIPDQMKAMHGFHHLSINTLPSTSLVQNFQEHFIYIATFGPAMILPYFVIGYQHWIVIAGYLVLFDIVNAFGHTNIRCRHWIFENKFSPIRYLFYTPEFHLGHHSYYNKNYALFMPLWDHLFSTYREYKKVDSLKPSSNQQDFVFIGHNGGLGHLLTLPELSIYNIYDKYYRTFLPIEVELLISHAIIQIAKLFLSEYRVSRYCITNKYIGRIICILQSPLDYMNRRKYNEINNDIIQLIYRQYRYYNTKHFGLGNLNKMKPLNDGGSQIVSLLNEHEFLHDKDIKIWTGDTLTTASIYQQIIKIKNLKKLFYIGATGKIGKAVCKLLTDKGIEIVVYTNYPEHNNTNTNKLITYVSDINEMVNYKYIIIGKSLHNSIYHNIFNKFYNNSTSNSKYNNTYYLLDYTVPYLPVNINSNIKHMQIGLLKVVNNSFCKGYFDICMGTEQNQLYPCHAGCMINLIENRKTHEIGDIDLKEVDIMWKKALDYGLDNIDVDIE